MNLVEKTGPPASVNGAAAETVLIRVPADPDYLAIVRSATAHVATRIGCTLSEVADLRLAVDEACNLLLRGAIRHRRTGDGTSAATGDLDCRFLIEPLCLRVHLDLQAGHVDRPEDDGFGWVILSALVDDVAWHADGSTTRVEIVKRRAA